MMVCENATDELPEPSNEPPVVGTRVPNASFGVPGFVIAYRNQPVEAEPPGLPVPFSVAVVPLSDVAALVITAGANGAVVSDKIEPKDVP